MTTVELVPSPRKNHHLLRVRIRFSVFEEARALAQELSQIQGQRVTVSDLVRSSLATALQTYKAARMARDLLATDEGRDIAAQFEQQVASAAMSCLPVAAKLQKMMADGQTTLVPVPADSSEEDDEDDFGDDEDEDENKEDADDESPVGVADSAQVSSSCNSQSFNHARGAHQPARMTAVSTKNDKTPGIPGGAVVRFS